MSKFKPNPSFQPSARPERAVRSIPQESTLETIPPAAIEIPDDASANTPQSIALKLTLLFLFFRISYLHELLTAKIKVDLHVLLVLAALSFLTILVSGRLLRALRNRIGKLWALFALCLCVATVFSSWRGGSVSLLLMYLRTGFPLLFLIPAVVETKKDLSQIMTAMGLGGIATIMIGFTTKDFVDGRIVLRDVLSIGDSNDYAAQLIFVIPFVAWLAFGANRNIGRMILGSGVLCAAIYQILSTGSRGGFVSAAATLFIVLLISKPSVKAAMLIGFPALALLALPLVPHESVARFESLFQSGSDVHDAASESSKARRRLLAQSIELTFSNPLVGVGPGQFMDSEGALAKENGQRGMWHATHNTYTQVSSECGIPAFLFFVSALGLTLVSLWKTRKASDPLLAAVSTVVLISTIGFASCVVFLSHAYDFPLLVSSGFAIAIQQLLAKSEPRPIREMEPEGLSLFDPVSATTNGGGQRGLRMSPRYSGQ